PDWTARTWKKGSLEVVDGVPILRLEGTPEEMAEQHARLLGQEARALAESYLPAFVGGKKELEKARARARELFWPHLTDSEKAEVRVFARESGIDEKDVLLAQAFPDLYRAWGCSTLAAVKEGAAFGPLLARNLDFVSMGFIQDYSCVVVAKPAGKKAYVSIAWPGILGVLSAQNDSVALSVMVVHGDRGCEAGVPFELAFRRAIETCSTNDEVKACLEKTRLTVANNLMVVDAKGDASVYELIPGLGDVVARRPDAKGHLASTNHFQSRSLKEARASLTYLSSARRLEAVEKTCAREPKVGLDTAKAALRASAPGRINVQSMIFEPSKGVVHVAFGKPPAAERKFVRLDRATLLGR
ncbi:MAG: C45 family autoproteolytic acyltransferase/hydrolase, partial [Planctomycetota bacterium]